MVEVLCPAGKLEGWLAGDESEVAEVEGGSTTFCCEHAAHIRMNPNQQSASFERDGYIMTIRALVFEGNNQISTYSIGLAV
ncbi:MAG: hypothetical protein KTR25_01360 [Myxococcales bacterium]|nr:hypothetical protein [Myxococcales bacterium]